MCYQTQIAQLSFQLTRKKSYEELWKIGGMLDKLLISLSTDSLSTDSLSTDSLSTDSLSTDSLSALPGSNPYLLLLYKLIAYTRDIYGKGERDLSYIMIFIWYNHYPEYALRMLRLFVSSVGSWKDMKYLCRWVRDYSHQDHPLILECIKIMNLQFNIDRQSQDISMVAKWMPRESSAFGWLYEKMVIHWGSTLSEKLELNRLKKKYRTEISALNRRLDTPQIKQCCHKWSQINPENVSMITKNKQLHAFLNENTKNQKADRQADRQECKQNFESYFKKKTLHFSSTNFSMIEWTKDVIALSHKPSKHGLLLSAWSALHRSLPTMGNVIPILDLSMNRDILGLVFMIMEKSSLKNQLLIYDMFPRWFSPFRFENAQSSSVEGIYKHSTIIDKITYFRSFIKDKGIGNRIYDMIDLIIDTCLKTLSPESIEDMVFVLFTDYSSNIHSEIMTRFQTAGVLSPPHFIYWNTSSETNDIPFDEYVNATFFSGDSSSLLFLLGQLFIDDGRDIGDKRPIQKISSYDLLCNTLNNPRYDCYDFGYPL